MKRYVLTLDLKNDSELIRKYIEHHRNVWPEILESIIESGIVEMQIYHVADRLCMIIEADDDFSFQEKAAMDSANPKVQEWELLMDQYQKRLPFAREGGKWVLMEQIFQLNG